MKFNEIRSSKHMQIETLKIKKHRGGYDERNKSGIFVL